MENYKDDMVETVVSAETTTGDMPKQSDQEELRPMKWFKFIIYFQLFATMVSYAISAFMYFTGMIYGEDYEYMCAVLGDGLRVCDVCMGLLCLMIGIYAFYVRMRLAKYKKNGPLCYLILLGLDPVVLLVYAICLCLISGNWQLLFASNSLVNSTLEAALLIALNYIYFNKRKALFVN